MSDELLFEKIKSGISLYNTGSDNVEYLRGQVELAMFLLGWDTDDERLRLVLETIGE